MRRLTFHPRADRELTEAIRFLEQQRTGLGEAFLDDLLAATTRIREHPEAGPIFRGEVRRVLLSRFPYFVLYRTLGSEIRVLAVAHQRRRPGYGATRR